MCRGQDQSCSPAKKTKTIEIEGEINQKHEDNSFLLPTNQQELSSPSKFLENINNINFVQGDFVKAMCPKDKQFYTAKIIQVKAFENKVKIHYVGWNDRYDRVIMLPSSCLRNLTDEERKEIENKPQRKSRLKKGFSKINSKSSPQYMPHLDPLPLSTLVDNANNIQQPLTSQLKDGKKKTKENAENSPPQINLV